MFTVAQADNANKSVKTKHTQADIGECSLVKFLTSQWSVFTTSSRQLGCQQPCCGGGQFIHEQLGEPLPQAKQ